MVVILKMKKTFVDFWERFDIEIKKNATGKMLWLTTKRVNETSDSLNFCTAQKVLNELLMKVSRLASSEMPNEAGK